MKVVIKATAPTVHQLNSLKSFGLGYQENGNGSFSAEREFDTEQEAKDYLAERARMYNDDDPEGTEERLSGMLRDIEHGVLRLDAVSAVIEIIE